MQRYLFLIMAFIGFVLSSAYAEEPVATVRLEDNATLDYGEISEGTVAVGTLTLVNESNEELVIDDVYTGCGCVKAKYPETIPPGAKGKIELSFNSARYKGAVLRTVKIRTSGRPRILRAYLKARVTESTEQLS